MNNALKYVKILEGVGVTREQAEAHVQFISEFLEGDLATKQDVLNSETKLNLSMNQLEDKIEDIEESLNLSIARLDSRLSSAIAKLDNKFTQAITHLDAKLNSSVARLDTKIETATEHLENKILQSEYRMTIKLGAIITLAIAAATAVMKLL